MTVCLLVYLLIYPLSSVYNTRLVKVCWIHLWTGVPSPHIKRWGIRTRHVSLKIGFSYISFLLLFHWNATSLDCLSWSWFTSSSCSYHYQYDYRTWELYHSYQMETPVGGFLRIGVRLIFFFYLLRVNSLSDVL